MPFYQVTRLANTQDYVRKGLVPAQQENVYPVEGSAIVEAEGGPEAVAIVAGQSPGDYVFAKVFPATASVVVV